MISFHLYAKDDLKVISSSKTGLVIEYTPTLTDSSEVSIDNLKYLRLQVKDGIFNTKNIPGMPLKTKKIINIGVPGELGNTIEILQSSYTEFSGLLLPSPKVKKIEKLTSDVYERGKDYGKDEDNELVSFGQYGIMKGLPVQQLVISPVSFSAGSRTIRFYKKIVFRINFNSAQTINNQISDNTLSGVVLNFDAAKYWSVAKTKTVKKVSDVSSVLASGRWFRFDVTDEGIYKITKQMLSSYGIDASTVDPRTIKIYNNGGTVLPEKVTADRPVDLVENAIMVVGEDDGKFDDNDYILFYGRNVKFQNYNKSAGTIDFEMNPFSNHNYYWITSGGSKGKRIQAKNSLNVSDRYVQTTSNAYVYKKDELINLAKSGRYFYGDEFSQSVQSRNYVNKLDGYVPNTKINYLMSFINSSSDYQLIEVFENSNALYSRYIYGISSDSNADYSYGCESVFGASYTGAISDNRSNLKFQFNATTSSSKGYLNYFQISYTRSLSAVDDFILFYSKDTTSVIEYQLSGFSSSTINVFDVSDNANVRLVSSPILQSGGDYNFQAAESLKTVVKYIAVTPTAYKTPGSGAEVANQNLRGNLTGSKLIIITNKSFADQAAKLKNYRENEAPVKISASVFYTDQIFNEFSGGSVDVSGLRDFIKYAYDNWTIKPEYVLLWGDGDYDYKDIEKNGKNYVIPYETEYSLNTISSYCSDDFYSRVDGNDAFADIAIGRVNVQSAQDGENFVNKIIQYEKNSEMSSWRNTITLVADDGVGGDNDGVSFTDASEDLYDFYIPRSYGVNKIYEAEYPVVLTDNGRRIPEVNQALINAFNNGTLILNYVGHGNPEVLAHEQIFSRDVTIPKLKGDKYCFLCAATCDFGYYDDPTSQSSTEELLLKSDGGIIGALAATRPVFSGDNSTLNNAFFNKLLKSARDTNGLPITLGKAYMLTKATLGGENDQKYHLFGDPTMRLLSPVYTASIDSINGSSSNADVNVKALSTLKISGTVKKADNTTWTDFNGEGVLTVFDAERSLVLTQLYNYVISIPGGVIFNGKVSIVNGKFSASCVVPKDISYDNKNGKIVFYFYNQKQDGVGYSSSIIVGGSDSTSVNDKKGPQIDIYFDNDNLKNYALINTNSTLIVKLKDDTGLNTTGTGIGHKLEGILNKDENNPIDFTNYFTGDIDSCGRSGKINYKFDALTPGTNTLSVKAWDVFNNSNEASVDFTVVSGDDMEIRDVYNYPNPFRQNTTFTFQQNFAVPLDVKIKVYTVAGRLIKEIEKKNIIEKFVKIDWDGRDADGNQLANGAYLYKLNVKTSDGAYNKNLTGKLAVIR